MKLSAVPKEQPQRDTAASPAEDAATTALPLIPLSGWGRYPIIRGIEARSEHLERITAGAVLTRGLGRSYGDASLPPADHHSVAASPLADRLIAFDPASGRLRAEACLSLAKLVEVFLPRGWFTPVTPGTQFVTLGGMVAADVHGKNHHRDGCFGEHVSALTMRVADGRIIECSAAHEPELLRATLGGMGLTGHILEVEFRMKPVPSAWIWSESERLPDLDSLIDCVKRSSASWPYTVCWMDGLSTGAALGRGIVMRGRWAEPAEAPPHLPAKKPTLSVPITLPPWALQSWAVKAFNSVYYWQHGQRTHRGIVHPQAFFYPLDVIHHWNRVYGPRGFTQYQCVLPATGPHPSLHKFLRVMTEHGGTPFLCVVKDCGAEGTGMISFPKPGITFALDFPIGPHTQRLVDALNAVVIAEGGRIYLAKDAFTRAEHFRAMEPRLDAWTNVRRKWDPKGTLRSALSVRLFGDQP
jgi:decaprenylphospho-beta-D-ribofuranose 2-oxidase